MGIAIAGVLLWACEKDRIGGIWQTSDDFKEYQTWFESEYLEILPFSLFDAEVSHPGTPKVLVKPVWSLSRLHIEDPIYDFLEVPLETNGIVALDRSGNHDQIGLTRMLIRKNRLSGQKGAYFITLLCDKKFIENHPKAYLISSLTDLPDDFSGTILIHTLNGGFKGGRMVEKGRRITGKLLTEYELSRSDIIHTRSPCVYIVRVQIYYQNQYLLSLESEIGGQPVVFGPKVIDDGITVETGEFTVDNCDQDPDDDIDPQDPWTWVSTNISTPTPTPDPCDGQNIVGGTIEIVPTYNGNSEESGLYGCVRYTTSSSSCSGCGGNVNGKNKCHRGFDIKSDVGDDVYSMFNGKVISTVSGWPNSCNNNAPSMGNSIKIQSEINGETKVFHYGHLTSVSVYIDDIITAGQKIGTSGKSGNACSAQYPHVHLRVADENGNGWFDPTSYVNFSYSINGNSVNINPCN